MKYQIHIPRPTPVEGGSAEDLLRRAAQFADAGEYVKACGLYQEVVANEPSHALAQWTWGGTVQPGAFQRGSELSASGHRFGVASSARTLRRKSFYEEPWRRRMSGSTSENVLDVPYEELVTDQESWTRRILDFIGLEWDEQCFEFHRASRPVITSSSWQVRQRIYKGSVGRWRNYEEFLGPLRELSELL